MSVVFVCPSCGEKFPEADADDSCPACIEPLQAINDHTRKHSDDVLTTPELTGPERAIDEMMRRNRGVRA